MDLLQRLESFTFVMMTGRPALRAARDWSLRAIGAELAAGAQPHGFHEADASAFDHGAPAGSPLAAWLDEPGVADWLVQAAPPRDEIAPRLALAAALRGRTPARALDAAFEAAAVRQALCEPADPDDLLEATSDVALTLGRAAIARAIGCGGDVAAFARTFAALARHSIDGRALRAGRTDACDLAIRFRAHAAPAASAAQVAAFVALYESGVATALAEIALAHGRIRRLVRDATAQDRVLAGALLLDRAGPTPAALGAGLALKRLCDAQGGALAAAWSAPSPHTAVARMALAPV